MTHVKEGMRIIVSINQVMAMPSGWKSYTSKDSKTYSLHMQKKKHKTTKFPFFQSAVTAFASKQVTSTT